MAVIGGITIDPGINADTYWINSKEVYEDTNGNWITREELTKSEVNAFKCYIGREIKLQNESS